MTTWTAITKQEFYYHLNDIALTHLIRRETDSYNENSARYFVTTIKGEKVDCLSKYTNSLGNTTYYKNIDIIGEPDYD